MNANAHVNDLINELCKNKNKEKNNTQESLNKNPEEFLNSLLDMLKFNSLLEFK